MHLSLKQNIHLMPARLTVFNRLNNITVIEGDTTDPNSLKQALEAVLSDSKKNSAAAPLVAYSNNSGVQELGINDIDVSYTAQVLYRLGFSWPETGSEYIRQFIRKLDELSFFEE